MSDHEKKPHSKAVKRTPGPPQVYADSKFVGALSPSEFYLRKAANLAHAGVLTDVEIDAARAMVAKLEEHLERVKEKLYRPGHVKDADEEFGKILGEQEGGA